MATTCVALISFFALVCWAGLPQLHAGNMCYDCRALCFKTEEGAEKSGKVKELNEKFCPESCLNVDSEKSKVKDCGNQACYSAIAIIGKHTESGQKVRATFIERGCIPECSSEKVCDMSKLKQCGMSENLQKSIESRISDGQNEIDKQFDSNFKKPEGKGSGGELHCCYGDRCNNKSEPTIAHTYVHDEF